MEDFEMLLKEKGYRFTEQRQIILNVMLESMGEHLSIKEIWEIARKKDSTLGISTVYRTLKIMAEIGIVTDFDKKDEINKYELNTDEKNFIHPHLICMRCGKIIGIQENLLIGNPKVKIYNKYNFKIEDIRVKCYGFCEKCAEESVKNVK